MANQGGIGGPFGGFSGAFERSAADRLDRIDSRQDRIEARLDRLDGRIDRVEDGGRDKITDLQMRVIALEAEVRALKSDPPVTP